MKKRHITLIIYLSLIPFTLLSLYGFTLFRPTGAPEGHTNSPADGKNCTACHGGTAQSGSGFISSNIPAEGYTPGNDYTITVTVDGSGKKGFQVSPQDNNGNLVGTMTAGSDNQLVGNDKYVTHNSAKTDDPATWDFSWTAPAAGTGDVTFYGSTVSGKPNVTTGTYVVSEKQSNFIAKPEQFKNIQLYPNPVSEVLNISFSIREAGNISIEIISLEGRNITTLEDSYQEAGNYKNSFYLPNKIKNGISLLKIGKADQDYTRKIQIRH